MNGGALIDVARNGTLAYMPGNLQSARTNISWMDADGRFTPIVATLADYRSPAISPDGKRLAYTIVTEKATDLWVYDVARETPTQLTFNVLRSVYEVVWTHDGKHLLYGSRSPDPGLWSVRADGSGAPERLSSNDTRVHAISPDGTRIAFTRAEPIGGADLFTAALDTSDPEHPKLGTAETFLATPNLEVDPAFSPDGHWLAYSSTESGTGEIFVRPFPPKSGGKVRISTGGGKFPLWSHTGGQLFFVAADGHIMVADYTVRQGDFDNGKPRVWSVTPIFRTGVNRNLDLHPDGKRFAVFPIPGNTTTPEGGAHVTFVLNFFEELKRKVP